MEFVRKKKRGQNQKVQKLWLSKEGYRIIWRKEVFGISVPARFQATVRTIIPNYSGKEGESYEIWDFTDMNRRLFKVRGKAEESCLRHYRLWCKACEATGIRQLTDLFGGKLPIAFPAWVRKKLPRKIYELLTRPRTAKYQDEEEECPETSSPAGGEPNPADLTKTSDSSASSTEVTADAPTPASPAEGKDGSTTRKTRRARSKATDTSDNSPAKPAKAPAKGRGKRVSKRTAKSSKPTKRKRKSTTDSSDSAAKPSKGSKAKKSKPSEN
jgi:hypothetical protein